MDLFLVKDIYSAELILFHISCQPKRGKNLYVTTPDLEEAEQLEQLEYHIVPILIALGKVQLFKTDREFRGPRTCMY